MFRKLSDCIVVITGASSGIGKATALKFANKQANLVLGARRIEALEEVAEECREAGGKAICIQTDVTDEQAVKELARKAIDEFGRIDIWVNNAGVTLFSKFEETPPEAFRQVVETNLFGYVHGARAALPYFREQKHGILINNASFIGKVGAPYLSAYCVSKFGVVGLGESLRMELRETPDIHVCTILPASIDTPLFQNAANYTGRAVKPMDPVYSPDDVAEAIVSCARRPRREIVVGTAGKQSLLMRTAFPPYAEKKLARKMSENQFQDRHSDAYEGNLFEPSDRYRSTSGGWRQPKGESHKTAIYIGLGVITIGVLVGLAVVNRPKISAYGRRQEGWWGNGKKHDSWLGKGKKHQSWFGNGRSERNWLGQSKKSNGWFSDSGDEESWTGSMMKKAAKGGALMAAGKAAKKWWQ